MALKYPSLDCLAAVWRSRVWSFFALCVSLVNWLRRVVRRGVHQSFDLGEGLERGVWVSMVEMRVQRAEEYQWSSCLGEGLSGAW